MCRRQGFAGVLEALDRFSERALEAQLRLKLIIFMILLLILVVFMRRGGLIPTPGHGARDTGARQREPW